MAPLSAFTPLLFAGLAAAKQCSTLTIPVDISSRQGLFKQVPVESNLDAGAFATRNNRYQANYTAELLTGYQTLNKSYNISAQYCKGSGKTIQLLTHGIGFDKTYWDLPFANYNYSYVETALASGYSTLAIDRLGVGNSSHGDPFNEIQAQAEVEALNAVTTKIRKGAISEVGTYNKVIHVGHSFGSVQSFWLSALYPNNTDGVVLTGYSTAPMFLAYFTAGNNLHSARLNQPFRLGNASDQGIKNAAAKYGLSKDISTSLYKALSSTGAGISSTDVNNIVTQTEILDLITGYNETVFQYNYPSGYFVNSDLTTLQYLFLYPGNFNTQFAEMGEQTKQPVTVGELLTIGSAPKMSPFKGPVLVITGEHDVPFCGGNCYGMLPNSTAKTIPEGVKMAYPSASAFEAVVQPGTGHGLNFQYNATAGYKVIQNFLGAHGLAA